MQHRNFNKGAPKSLLLRLRLVTVHEDTRNWITIKDYVLLCRTEACWKLPSYLHVESRHNETHVLTVDAAPGADLLSWTRFPERNNEMKREERRKRERRNTRTSGQRGPLCTKPPLESATSDLEDQDHDNLDNIRLSRSCRQNSVT